MGVRRRSVASGVELVRKEIGFGCVEGQESSGEEGGGIRGDVEPPATIAAVSGQPMLQNASKTQRNLL